MAFPLIQQHSVRLHWVQASNHFRSFAAFSIGGLGWEEDGCGIVLAVVRCSLPLLPWTAEAFGRTYLPSPPSAAAAQAGLPFPTLSHRVSTSWCQWVVAAEEGHTSSPAHHQTEGIGGGPWGGVRHRLDAVGGDVAVAADVAAAVDDDVVVVAPPPGAGRVRK